MTSPEVGTRPRHRARLPMLRRLGVTVLAAASLVLVVQGVGVGSGARTVSVERPTASPSTGSTTGTTTGTKAGIPAAAETVAPAPVVAAVQDSPPRRVRIDRIGVSATVIDLGLQDDGTVEVPERPEQVGWFSLGPTPGSVGSSVLLGHVDSVDGPAVFARLSELRAGDRIEVDLDAGGTEVFEVREVTAYLNDDFPATRVYADHGDRALNLVTCGGEYDADRGGYQSNVVVYTRRVTGPSGTVHP